MHGDVYNAGVIWKNLFPDFDVLAGCEGRISCHK